MAFHLHRLKLVGRALLEAGFHKTDASDLAAARVTLNPMRIQELAAALDVPEPELTRPLMPDEEREWHFYRIAAQHPDTVWRNARGAWTAHGLDQKRAAALMGYSAKRLSKALALNRPLHFHAAARLTTALKTPGGPEALLPSPKCDDQQPSR